MNAGRTVLIPLPDQGFDVTEVAVPWSVLRRAGHTVVFATERGAPACADPLLLKGVLLGKLGAAPEAVRLYRELEQATEFQRPLAWGALFPGDFNGLVLPGGHAPGMRQYLGSTSLLAWVSAFWELRRPVGAICHGVLILARARDASGKSLLFRRRTTCLPRYMERSAYWLTAWKLKRYYRTYEAYVEEEVRAALEVPDTQFIRGPVVLARRGTEEDDRAAFVVEDANYVSARWPGDAYLFARRFGARVASTASAPGS